MPAFTYYSTVEVPELPDGLDWDEYCYRQRVHRVHSQTKTSPLIWDEALQGNVIYYKWYDHFKPFLDNLQDTLGVGYIQSAILIKLPAGKAIPTHVDAAPFFKQYHRLHLAMVTNPACIFTVGAESKHLKVGEIWEIDNDNQKHSVVNNGQQDRVHLLIDFYKAHLVISTHSRFMVRDRVVHTGRGVYYGIVNTEDPNIEWVVSRGAATEALLKIDMISGELLDEKPIPSKFTHDCIRHGDKVYIADTGNGRIVILNYPGLDVYKILNIFTIQNHINTLFYDDATDVLWCLLHNHGKSILVGVDPETGERRETYTNVGFQSHGIVKWRNGFLVLSSAESRLIFITRRTTEVLFTDTRGTFLKGLMMIGNKVYFGASPPFPRNNRGDPGLMCDIICVDPATRQMLSRTKMETRGLLNTGTPR